MNAIQHIDQMELSLDGASNPHPERRQRRLQRAGWWFGQMRRAVDRALDRGPKPRPRPEQKYFGLAKMTPPRPLSM